MRILALDSSGLVASVAVVAGADGKADAQTIGEYTMNYKKTHSQTLLPMLDELVKMTEVDLKTIDAIAVAAGPGSFTGLRIGSATAKGLGLALEKPLIHIPTLEGLAYNLYGIEGLICPIMDARRGQVYTGIYRFDTVGELRIVEDQMAVSRKASRLWRKSYGPWRRRTGIQRTNHRRTACRSVGFFRTGTFKSAEGCICGGIGAYLLCRWKSRDCGRTSAGLSQSISG